MPNIQPVCPTLQPISSVCTQIPVINIIISSLNLLGVYCVRICVSWMRHVAGAHFIQKMFLEEIKMIEGG